MKRPTRRLTPDEAEIWARVAKTVTPLERRRPAPPVVTSLEPLAQPAPPPFKRIKGRVPAPLLPKPAPETPKAIPPAPLGLDSSWERKVSRGTVEPEFHLDLHGSNLDQAYVRLMRGLVQAKAMGARVVLIVTGKPRPVDAADRADRRGAIRAKIVDWLSASEHAHDIAAIRGAHRKHGGHGAIYVVLKKRR